MKNREIVEYWMEKAADDLQSAKANVASGRNSNAIRDAYFACFHALSSLLFKSGKSFRKHKEARASLHRDFIRTKKIDSFWGKHYDWLFNNRHKADYRPLVAFEKDQVKESVEKSDEFVELVRSIIDSEDKSA